MVVKSLQTSAPKKLWKLGLNFFSVLGINRNNNFSDSGVCLRYQMILKQLTLPVLSSPAIIGAPQVEYIPYVRSIKFLIRPPVTPLRGEDDQQLTVEDIYSKFGAVDYHLTIFNQRTHQQVKHHLRHWDSVNPISDKLEKDLRVHTGWRRFLMYKGKS